MKILNQGLYDRYLDACAAVFRLLISRYGNRKPSYVIRKKRVFHRNGSWSTTYVKTRDLSPKVFLLDKEINGLPEIKELVKFLDRDKRIELLRSYGANPVAFNPKSDAHNFLSNLIGRTLSYRFSLEEFNKLYEIYEEHLYLDHIYYRSFCLLRNFDSDMKRINLAGGLCIKRISNKERERVLESPRSDLHLAISTKWIIETRHKMKRRDGFPHPGANEQFNDLVTALRLFKEGIVGSGDTYTYPLSKWDKTCYGTLSNRYFHGKSYALNKSDSFAFRRLWKRYSHLKTKGILAKRPEIEIALTRLNFAYERERLEDKLIDYMIAFEAILLTGEGEKSFRLKLMAPFLLGSTWQESADRCTYMKKVSAYLSEAYDLRSKIVHGSKRLPKDIKLENSNIAVGEFVDNIGCYLRSAVNNYLDRAELATKKKILEELAGSIFDIHGQTS